MSEIELAQFSWGETPGHSRIHEVAVREARAAADHRAGATGAPRRRGLLDRVGVARIRLALAGGPAATADACGCAA